MVPGSSVRDVRDPDGVRRHPDGRRAPGFAGQPQGAPAVSERMALTVVARFVQWSRAGRPVLR